jgi:hypothetical protein
MFSAGENVWKHARRAASQQQQQLSPSSIPWYYNNADVLNITW